jgi:hypothetical protein
MQDTQKSKYIQKKQYNYVGQMLFFIKIVLLPTTSLIINKDL